MEQMNCRYQENVAENKKWAQDFDSMKLLLK